MDISTIDMRKCDIAGVPCYDDGKDTHRVEVFYVVDDRGRGMYRLYGVAEDCTKRTREYGYNSAVYTSQGFARLAWREGGAGTPARLTPRRARHPTNKALQDRFWRALLRRTSFDTLRF